MQLQELNQAQQQEYMILQEVVTFDYPVTLYTVIEHRAIMTMCEDSM